MSCVKIRDEVRAIGKVLGWFPTVVTCIIAFPLDEVLELVAVSAAIQYVVKLIFKLVIYLDRLWRWWCLTVYFISLPRRETINVENRMLMHGGREL